MTETLQNDFMSVSPPTSFCPTLESSVMQYTEYTECTESHTIPAPSTVPSTTCQTGKAEDVLSIFQQISYDTEDEEEDNETLTHCSTRSYHSADDDHVVLQQLRQERVSPLTKNLPQVRVRSHSWGQDPELITNRAADRRQCAPKYWHKPQRVRPNARSKHSKHSKPYFSNFYSSNTGKSGNRRDSYSRYGIHRQDVVKPFSRQPLNAHDKHDRNDQNDPRSVDRWNNLNNRGYAVRSPNH